MKCGGSTPLWISTERLNPKRRPGAALQSASHRTPKAASRRRLHLRQVLLEEVQHLADRVGDLVPVADDALDLERVHLLLQMNAEVDVMDALARLGVGGQRALGLAVECVDR